jgi:5'-phosphate synthase pdxT subunit
MEGEVLGVFIRAPIVTEVGAEVEVLSRFDDQIVAVRSGGVLGTSFHPELTPDTRLHGWFVSL